MYSNHSDLGKEFHLTGQLGWTRLLLGQKSNNAEFSRSLNTNYKGQKLEHWKWKTKEKSSSVKLSTKGIQAQRHTPVVPARMWAAAGSRKLVTQPQSHTETLQSTQSYKASRRTIRNDQE